MLQMECERMMTNETTACNQNKRKKKNETVWHCRYLQKGEHIYFNNVQITYWHTRNTIKTVIAICRKHETVALVVDRP